MIQRNYKFIRKNKLFEIETYMNKENLKKYNFCEIDLLKLNDILLGLNKNPPLLGGYYENKYKYYKLKYLNLKNN